MNSFGQCVVVPCTCMKMFIHFQGRWKNAMHVGIVCESNYVHMYGNFKIMLSQCRNKTNHKQSSVLVVFSKSQSTICRRQSTDIKKAQYLNVNGIFCQVFDIKPIKILFMMHCRAFVQHTLRVSGIILLGN